MSSIGDSKSLKQRGNEDTVKLVPPFHNRIEFFDNEDMGPDLEFVVAGMEKPLQLHAWILTRTSKWLDETVKGRKGIQLEWLYDTTKEVDRGVLVKALRFCYGETQSVGTKDGECCAMIATLMRLQVTCLDDVVGPLINFVVEEAKRKVETGVELLKACTKYSECCDSSLLSLNKKLAAIVLKKENMYDHYKDVVDECLMMLPSEYLMLAEFGEPHTRFSEFSLRTKYFRYHTEMKQVDKQVIMAQCDWSLLNSQELRELRLMDTVYKDELLEAYEKALKHCEIENEMARRAEKLMEERVKELEKEKAKESQRAKKAEREAEEQRERAERAEKEKEKVKQVEMERYKRAKEAEEYQRRAEKAEKKKVRHTETLNPSLQRNGLHTYSCQSE